MKTVMQFRVELLETRPPVWRCIVLPADSTYWDLHVAIQDSMGWEDSHLHMFEAEDPQEARIEIGVPDPDDEVEMIAGWERELAEDFDEPGDRMIYVYDLGDGWRHSVELESIEEAQPDTAYPACLEGERKCPPEDVGGIPGYEEFLQAIADPGNKEYAELLDWYGGSFDPDDFDPKEVAFEDPRKKLDALL